MVKISQVRFRDTLGRYPIGFFDVASRHRKCGCCTFLVIKPSTFYHLWWEGGEGTNNQAEVIGLWGILKATKWIGMVNIKIYDDAKGVID